MKIIFASASGMCFGVRDALDVLAGIDQPPSVAIYGELVHNDVVLNQLRARGFHQIAETGRTELPEFDQIVITAHGISNHRRQQLTQGVKTLIDTTCPLVVRVHRAAQELAQSGAFIVVIGRADHVEVEGITGDLDRFAVAPSVDSVKTYPSLHIGIVCQTTFPCDEAAGIRRQIEICNPAARIQWVDTICQPTKDRQQALKEMLELVEAVVVVGGRNSHNTLRLVETCRQHGLATLHVEHSEELQPAWFDGIKTVGLTAGTSTLPETLQEVYDRLGQIAGHDAATERAEPL